MPPDITLREWLRQATDAEISRLERMTGSSIGYINHIMYGIRSASADMAGKLESATQKINGKRVKREHTCPACAKCPLAKVAREQENNK